jgi:hypothetical protein
MGELAPWLRPDPRWKLPDDLRWQPPPAPAPRWHRRGPVTHTPWYWRAAGATALPSGVTALVLMDWCAGGWRHPIRALRGVWDDWYQAFFA